MSNAFKLRVFGVVQGVNFRNMTAAYAKKHGLRGTVMNLDHGGVEIVVRCSEKQKEALVDWLRSSPGFSAVREVEESVLKEVPDFEGFEILREGGFLKDQARSLKNFGKGILKL